MISNFRGEYITLQSCCHQKDLPFASGVLLALDIMLMFLPVSSIRFQFLMLEFLPQQNMYPLVN